LSLNAHTDLRISGNKTILNAAINFCELQTGDPVNIKNFVKKNFFYDLYYRIYSIQFHSTMLDHPPSLTDPGIRQETILALDSGMAIWMMYNHGFIVKTPEVVFAFDLTDGYSGWPYLYPMRSSIRSKAVYNALPYRSLFSENKKHGPGEWRCGDRARRTA